MQLPKKCVVCGTSNDLNTSLEVTIMGQAYKVFICKDHEDTTPKVARDKLKEQLNKLDEIIESARVYGMVCISDEEYQSLKSKKAAAPKKLVMANNAIVEKMTQQPSSLQPLETSLDGKVKFQDYVPAVESKTIKDAPAEYAVGTQSSFKVGRETGLQEEVKTFTTKEGRPVTIPTTLKSQLGTTKISIIQNISDVDIQRKGKMVSDAANHGTKIGASEQVSQCGNCRGLGVVRDVICKRCGGAGILL